MLQSVKGIYRQGKIELLETPNNLEESSVIITFLEDKPIQKYAKLMCFGMFTGDYQSTEEDFSFAEFQGDADDHLDWS